MIVSTNGALKRLSSPDNLINKLRDIRKPSQSQPALNIFTKRDSLPASHPTSQDSDSHSNSSTASLRAVHSPNNQVSRIPEVIPQSHEIHVDEILDNVDSKIKLQQAHNMSLDVLVRAVEVLSMKINEVKPDRLPAVIQAAAKTVEGIRREKLEMHKDRKDRQVHFHFYEPKRKTLADLGEALEV